MRTRTQRRCNRGDDDRRQRTSSVIGDPDPYYDDCSGSETVGMSSTNKNIGDLLSAKGITWGWFQGGFTPTTSSSRPTGNRRCSGGMRHHDESHRRHPRDGLQRRTTIRFNTTPVHLQSAPPAASRRSEIGHNGPANHQYDLSYFQKAALAGRSAGGQLPEGEPRAGRTPGQFVSSR